MRKYRKNDDRRLISDPRKRRCDRFLNRIAGERRVIWETVSLETRSGRLSDHDGSFHCLARNWATSPFASLPIDLELSVHKRNAFMVQFVILFIYPLVFFYFYLKIFS